MFVLVFEIGLVLFCFVSFSSPAMRWQMKLRHFLASRETASFAMNLKQSIEQVRIKARWVESIKQEESIEELVRGLACIG